ncbi:hypothetical protein N7536_007376 [Penicillium majusculum]|uniref:Uncharacterized protein n=1 Tax=Penicillium solitum TaxID=60172 RepID=A0A1V6RLJ7_9EURO|nr:uncharacterized protein PENSOL_c002G05229 [Penicillium solitum]KAJ5696964.1 hypothetical protein N7536_007376 [Penicillium majusculum]OQE02675.1 hypothetical protein PENSOL_c002G05229 [Penicillium solitum]
MSELLFESQESKAGPDCDDRPPQYDSCQPSQDILTSVIENEHTRRILLQRLDNLGTEFLKLAENNKPTETDYLLFAELLLEMGRSFTEAMQVTTQLGNIYKERTVRNTELYIAMSRLTASEFNQTYASLRRDPNQQMRHELDQDHKDGGDCYDRDCGSNSQRSLETKQIEGAGSPCSCDRFFELSAKVDKINNQLGQSLQSHDTVNVSKTTHNTPAKARRGFWKRNLKHLVLP